MVDTIRSAAIKNTQIQIGRRDNPPQPEAELPFLSKAQWHQLLVTWNATQAPYPQELSISQLFEEQVLRTPEAVALVFEGQEMTYRELNERANCLAHRLCRLGVEPEVRVGLSVERSMEMVVGLLGILKAGGAYVPLDPAYPQERLAFMLNDAETTMLITQQRLLEQLPPYEQVVCLDAEWQTLGKESKENLAAPITGENLAYLMYTSGSSGQPKGVLGTHRAAINRFHWMWTTYPFDAEEICSQRTPLSFVASVWEIFGPLLKGIRVVILPDRVVRDPKHLLHTLASHAVTRIVLVPSLLRALLETDEDLKSMLPYLKYCISSGETLPLDLALHFMSRMPQCILLNLYGSSEVAADVTCYDMRDYQSLPCIPIGRPIANTQIYLLDEQMQPVPVGQPGEIYVGGDGLARGYFNRSELTAAMFVHNPFSHQSDARLYKTGDLARYLPDGNIEYLGRLDSQVKIRGVRIELGEIEAILRQHPAIREVVVVAQEDPSGEKRLVAYVSLHKEQNLTASDLQHHVMKALPSSMILSVFVELEALPLTPNGKVDRRALPVPTLARQLRGEPFVAPQSMIHHQLRQIWEEEKSSRSVVVPLQARGSEQPFFYLHEALEGNAFYCFYLAHYLGSNQPFYAIPPYNFDGLLDAPTIEEMAAAHLQSIRSIQPEGPYLLGGFCNGGLLAYEMAQQLQAQGQQVDLLVLIEPAFPPVSHVLTYSVIRQVSKLFRLSREQQLACFLHVRHLYKYMRGERRSVEDLKAFQNIDPSILTLIPTTNALLQDNYALFDWSIAEYNYAPYSNKMIMIWASEEPSHGWWWQKAAQEKNIEIRFVPGTHRSCRSDHIQALAEELGRCFGRVQTTEWKEGKHNENVPASVD